MRVPELELELEFEFNAIAELELELLNSIAPLVLCPSTPAWTRAVATGGAADPHSRSLLSGSI